MVSNCTPQCHLVSYVQPLAVKSLSNYSGKCNTANDCKLAVNICSVVLVLRRPRLDAKILNYANDDARLYIQYTYI